MPAMGGKRTLALNRASLIPLDDFRVVWPDFFPAIAQTDNERSNGSGDDYQLRFLEQPRPLVVSGPPDEEPDSQTDKGSNLNPPRLRLRHVWLPPPVRYRLRR
jgi:hypothetical protein